MKLILKISLIGMLVLPLLGLADASYLSFLHYAGEVPECSIVKGCEVVLTSKYATIAGVPLALLGVVYYASAFLLSYHYYLTYNRKSLSVLAILVGLGVLASGFLVYLQLGVIGAVCQFCMVSVAITLLLAASAAFRLLAKNEQNIIQ